MPLIIEGQVPSRWGHKVSSNMTVPTSRDLQSSACIRLALINNMPDAALEDTELQFFELLDIASGDTPVLLRLYSLTGIPRTERGQRHLNEFYFGLDDLWNARFDGIIVTGTEPHQPELRQEPYWSALANVLDWAERNTFSTVLSCLAAHAGVLYTDGIQRHRLSDKQFGVFEFARVGDHHLTSGTDRLRFPHSRWNEVRADELDACGYTILTQSVDGGVDSFIKKKNQSLFVHFQGHPEYGAHTLLKEYRRDVRRFIKHERESYPTMPKGYFDAGATELLLEFREAVLEDRCEDKLISFPETIVYGLESTWRASATYVYRNWLQYMLTRSTEVASFKAIPVSSAQVGQKGPAVL